MMQKQKSKNRRKPTSIHGKKKETIADEAFDPRELGKALDDGAAPAAPPSTSTPQRPPPPIDVLSYDVLVSIFAAIDDPDFVRRTIPLVCKEWAELYRSKDASPLHERLEVYFKKEIEKAVEAGQGVGRGRSPLVHSSRVISWAERRAGSVHTLHITAVEDGATKDFSFKEMGKLVTVTAPSLIDLIFDFDLYVRSQVKGELRRARGFYVLPDLKPFWKAMRDSVAPAGRLRTLGVTGADFSEPDLGPLGRLAGSLEKLVLRVFDVDDSRFPGPGDRGIPRRGIGLPRFPELLCDLTELKLLALAHHRKIEAIPAKISSLKKLTYLNLEGCRLSSLPKELGELSGLTELQLNGNENLGTALPAAEAFPAELGKMKSLQCLNLFWCRLGAVPAFVGELKSLRSLNLSGCSLSAVPVFVGELASLEILMLSANEGLGNAPQREAFPAALGKMKSLRRLHLTLCGLRAVPAFVGELASLEELVLAGNSLSSLPKELGKLSGLTRLDLSRNPNLGTTLPADEAFPAALGKMKSLRDLKLRECSLFAVPAFIGELESLKELFLASNSLSSLPKELGELSGLTELDLSSNPKLGTTLPADEAFPAELGKIKSLRDIKLRECGLRTVPAFLGELASLALLGLAENEKLGDAPQHSAFPAALGRMKSLEGLDLQGCGLRAVPAFVGELASLEFLNLSENGGLGDAPEDIAFPAALGKVKSLEGISFAGCGLRAVPAFVGELKSLEILNVSENEVDAAALDALRERCPRLREVIS